MLLPAQGAASVTPVPPCPAPCKPQVRPHCWEGKEFPQGVLAVELVLGGGVSFPQHVTSLGSGEPVTSFPLLSGKVWDRQLSCIILFFHHGGFPGSVSRNRAIYTGCMRKELMTQPRPGMASEQHGDNAGSLLSTRTATLSYTSCISNITTLPKLTTGSSNTLKTLH